MSQEKATTLVINSFLIRQTLYRITQAIATCVQWRVELSGIFLQNNRQKKLSYSHQQLQMEKKNVKMQERNRPRKKLVQ